MKTMKTMLLLLAAVAVLAMACGNGTTPEDGTEEESSPVIPGGIGTGGGGGGSPVTPGITVTNPTRALTPLEGTSPAYSELTVPFTLIVRALQAGDTMTVDLDPTDASTYGLTLAGSPVTLVNGANNLTLVYDGSTAVGAIANVGLDVTTAAAGFPATLTVSVGIYDGAADTRPIPVNQANVAAFNEYARTVGVGLIKHYKLAGNINLSGITWTAIGVDTNRFTGSFDGGGNAITGFNLPAGSRQGLFGVIGATGTVKNVRLTVTTSISADAMRGGIAGDNYGTVDNCHVTGSINGNSFIGGVAGSNSGTVINCSSNGTVTGVDNVGGVVGRNNGAGSTAQNCSFTGSVTGDFMVGGIAGESAGGGSSVNNCYSTGSVTGNNATNARTGGIVGNLTNSTARNCYTTSSVAAPGGGNNVGGVVGAVGVGTIIQYCVALNTGISASGSNIGRVAGAMASSTMADNYARNGLPFIGGGSNIDTDIDGADVYAGTTSGQYNNQVFWATTLGWNFGSIWQITSGGLPTLQ